MKNISFIYAGFLSVITLLWLAANPGLFEVAEFIQLRNFMVQYFGTLSIAIMSLIMILATRPVWLEDYTGGLDKTYRLHKWLGITVLVTSVIHWLWSNGPKWASALGLIEGGRRRSHGDQTGFSQLQGFFAGQRGFAEGIGEWAFYVAAALMIIALIKWFPYRWFAKTHTFIAGAYLVLVVHATLLFEFGNWISPIGIVTAVLLIAGTISACIVLAGRVGRNRQVAGKIVNIVRLPDIDTVQITIMPEAGWRGHKAGQFACVAFGDDERPHPFTISSHWNPEFPQITLLVKALGDYTETLPDNLRVGGDVRLEGPYGRFTFGQGNDRQVWIAGGIGLTPFLAKLEELALKPAAGEQNIDFYQVAPSEDATLMDRIRQLAHKAGVTLHVWRDDVDGLLKADRVRADIPDWHAASFWFCGPQPFAAALKRDLVREGLPAKSFHTELFEFR